MSRSAMPAVSRCALARLLLARRGLARLATGPRPWVLALWAGALFGAAGCKPSIGDACTLSQDCSLQGDRQCDTSQPQGYCTVFNCGSNGCPDHSACMAFHVAIPGCGFSDRGIARTARSFCLKTCNNDGDCRMGYVCRDVRGAPWNSACLDDNQVGKVCVVPPPVTSASVSEGDEDAGVCQASAPDGGGLTLVDGGEEGGIDGAADAPADGPTDAPADADAGPGDAGADAADAADGAG